MRTGYAVIWREGGGPQWTGKLELLPRTLRIEGGSNGSTQTLELPYEELETVGIQHGVGDAPAVLLTRRSGPPLLVSAFAQPGLVTELAERIGQEHQHATAESVLVLVPIRPERAAEARALVAQGPPFDPVAVGLDRHEVFLSDTEVLFLFHGPLNARTRLLEDAGLWEASAAWEDVLAAPPRVAEHGYSWSRDRGFTTPPAAGVGLGF